VIVGIGVDLVRIDRMSASLEKYGQRIAVRILSEHELAEFNGSSGQAGFLARRFAAKEAMAKALGTGFRGKLGLKHIAVVHDENGRPAISCSGPAREMLNARGIEHIHLSISDERDNALAFVVLESPGQNTD